MRGGRTTIVAAQTEDGAESAFLLVVGRDSYATYNLPASGSLTIGRGESNAVRIDDPLASRAHACLHVARGDVARGSGERQRDAHQGPADRSAASGSPIRIGDTIQIGSSVLIVQRRTAPAEVMRPETLRDAGRGRRRRRRRRPSEAMQRVHALAERAAAGTINVLITGETGVGKELLAETVHRAVAAARRAVRLPQLRGAVRDAARERAVRPRARARSPARWRPSRACSRRPPAARCFSTRSASCRWPTQAKLLRVIETREVTRLGSVRPRRIDVRFIAATNRDLEAEVGRGAFRQDLYFRLQRHHADHPAAARARRARSATWPSCSPAQICRELGRAAAVLPPAVIALLESYAWPGNIRELKNVIERAVLLCAGPIIGPEHLPLDKLSPGHGARERPLAARRHAEDRRRRRSATRSSPR